MLNEEFRDTTILNFRHVYSHPGDMEGVVKECYGMFEKVRIFLQPVEINTCEGLGWVLIELLNNAIRSPVSIAMNMGITDITAIDFYTYIIIRFIEKSLIPLSPGADK